MRWGRLRLEIPKVPAALFGSWLVVLAGWCALEAGELVATRVWLPPAVGESTTVLALLLTMSLLGVATFVWDAHTRSFSRPAGFGVLTLLPVGGVFVALGATALGLAVGAPAGVLVALSAIKHVRLQRTLSICQREDPWLRSEEYWTLLAPLEKRPRRVRWYYVQNEKQVVERRCRIWFADETTNDDPAGSVFDLFSNRHINVLLHLMGHTDKGEDLSHSVSAEIDVEPATMLERLAKELHREDATEELRTFDPAEHKEELRRYPPRARLHITVEPTLFGANVDIRYEYPDTLPSYGPASEA